MLAVSSDAEGIGGHARRRVRSLNSPPMTTGERTLDFRARRRRECQRQESEALVATVREPSNFFVLFNSKPPGGGRQFFPVGTTPCHRRPLISPDLYLTFLDLSRLQPTFDDPQAIQVDVLSPMVPGAASAR